MENRYHLILLTGFIHCCKSVENQWGIRVYIFGSFGYALRSTSGVVPTDLKIRFRFKTCLNLVILEKFEMQRHGLWRISGQISNGEISI